MKYIFVILSLICTTLYFAPDLFAVELPDAAQKEETLEAKVTKILEEKEILLEGATQKQLYQKLEMNVTRGSLKGTSIIVENGNLPVASVQKYLTGDTLVISYMKDFEGGDMFYITDYVRRGALVWLSLIFIIVVVVIGKWHGVTSLIGMGISFLIIFKFILPQIFAGNDPVTIAILGSSMMVPVTFYFSHGFNRKTTIAVVGTLISLVITAVLATIFVSIAKLSGFSSEEASFIQAFYPGAINIKGLLLAGIIISGVGVFDDVAVSQSAIVAQLKDVSKDMSFRELYTRAMNVGRDHIASVVNTLVLVYAGAALPLLILFIGTQKSFSEVINYELIAEEIVKALVASIGLILAVPITTFLAVMIYNRKTK